MKRTDFVKVTAVIEKDVMKEYDCVYLFFDGIAVTYKDEKYGFINENCDIIAPCIYDMVEDFHEGLGAVEKDGKYGFLDEKGCEIIPLIYDTVYSFSNGLAAVCKDNKWGYINHQGEVVIPIIYDHVERFYQGKALALKNKKFVELFANDYVEENQYSSEPIRRDEMHYIDVEDIYLTIGSDMPNNIIRFLGVPEYVTIFELENMVIVVKEKDYNKYLKKVEAIQSLIRKDFLTDVYGEIFDKKMYCKK